MTKTKSNIHLSKKTEGLVNCKLVAYGAWSEEMGEAELQAEAVVDTGATMSFASPGALAPFRRTACRGQPILASIQLGDGKRVDTTLVPYHLVVSIDGGKPIPLRVYEWKKCRFNFLIGLDVLRANSMSVHLHQDPTKDQVEVRDGEETDVDEGEHYMTFNQLLAFTRAGGELQECWAPLGDPSCEAVEDWFADPIHDKTGHTPSGGPACCGCSPQSVQGEEQCNGMEVDELRDPINTRSPSSIVDMDQLGQSDRQKKMDSATERIQKAIYSEYDDSIFKPAQYHHREAQVVDGHAIEHDIKLKPGAEPVWVKPIRQGREAEKILIEKLQSLIERGLYYPCEGGGWGSPAFLVKKAGGKDYRIVADYRKVNSLTIPEPVEIPVLLEAVERQAKATLYTKLDVGDAFWAIRASPKTQQIQCISTPLGNLCSTMMGQGLSGSPFTLTRLMNAIFRDERLGLNGVESYVSFYFDDICITSSDPDVFNPEVLKEHGRRVRNVLDKCKVYHLSINPKKIEMFRLNITFLGYVLMEGGRVGMERSKVESILALPAPSNKTDVRALLGALQHCKQFIQNLSLETAALSDLTGNCTFKWEKSHQLAWESVKRKLVESPVLHLPRGDGEFELETDASLTHVGAVLYEWQVQPNGEKEKVLLGYWSKKLNPAQRNYHTHGREQLALVEALKHWQRLFKYSANTTIWTDNSSITYLTDPSARVKGEELDPKETRLAESLRNFACQIKHIPGKDNRLADYLSRPPGAGKDLYKVLDLCAGTGTVLLALEKMAESGELQMSNALYYGAVDSERWARKVILRTYERIRERFPKLFARPPKDIFSLGENEVKKVAEQIRARKQKWDLVMAGTDCRDFSMARKDPPGMNGDRELFSHIQLIIQAVQEQNPNVRFLIECVAFGGLKYGEVEYTPQLADSWQQVQGLYEEIAGSSLRHEVINMKDHFVPQQRVRLFLRNFKKREEFPVLEKTFQDVLEADGETRLRAATTIMASSTASVRKEGLNDVRVKGTGESRSLRLIEEERLQGLPDGHTDIENIPKFERMKLIGNALPTPAVYFYMRAAMRPANIFKDLSEPDIELRSEAEQQFMELHALSTEPHAELNALSLSTLTQRISDVCHSDSDYRDLYATVRDGGEEEKRSIVHAKADGEGGIVVSESGQWIISEGDSEPEKDLRQEILEMVHDPYHNGFAIDWKYMKHHIMWSGMKKDLKRYIETCAQCNLGKNTTQTTKGKPLPLPVPDRPGQRLSMDMLSMPPEEASWGGQKRRYTGIIAWKDMFSKFCILIPYTGTLKAQEMADLYISHADQHFGDVTEIVSDRDQRYTSRVWQGIMKSKNIQQLKTTSHRPQGDGSSERLFRSVLEKLRVVLVAEKEDGGRKWPELLSGVQKTLNNNRHAATGHTPHLLHFGREMRSTLDLLTKPEKPIGHLEEHVREQEEKTGKAVLAAREALEKQREVMKKRRPENARQSFAPGDSVFIKDFPAGLAKKLQPRQKGPFTILEKKSDQVYVLQRRGVREQHTFNADRLMKVTGVEEALARFPRDRWSPPDAGAPNPLLGPVEITSIDYSVIPPRYLVKSTRNGPATIHEEDELVAHYANEADTPGAIRAVIHKYLEKKNLLVLKENEVPDPDLDPLGHKKYQDHRTLLYDRRTDALGPQYVRRSTTAGFEWELTQECVARLRFLANQEEPRAAQRASREVTFLEPPAPPSDLHSAEEERATQERRERFQEDRRRLMATPATQFMGDLPNHQEQGSDSDEEEEIRLEPGENDPSRSESEEPGDARARMLAEVNARGQEVLAEYLQGRDNESEGSERDPGEPIQSPVVTDADNIERVDVEECVDRLDCSEGLVEGEHSGVAEVHSAENDAQRRGVQACDQRRVAEEGEGERLEHPGLPEETEEAEPRRSDRLAGEPPENEGLALSGPMGTLALAEVVTHPLSDV